MGNEKDDYSVPGRVWLEEAWISNKFQIHYNPTRKLPTEGFIEYVRADLATPASTAPDLDEDYALDMAVGEKWLLHKPAAERVVARIADNDCLTCKHWSADAVYAIAVELAAAAAAAAPVEQSEPVRRARDWLKTYEAEKTYEGVDQMFRYVAQLITDLLDEKAR